MKHYGLLGGKLGHSLSPQIHELFFKYTGIEGDYSLWETPQEELPARMELLRKECTGSNVTIPHKLHVMPLLDMVLKAIILITSALAECWNIMILTCVQSVSLCWALAVRRVLLSNIWQISV